MKPTILNREFQHPSDGWYQIETPGEHPNEKSGVLQVIDGAAVDSIVNRFNQEADDYQKQYGKPFPGMLIDHEHFKNQADKETVAYGWLMRLEIGTAFLLARSPGRARASPRLMAAITDFLAVNMIRAIWLFWTIEKN